VGFYLRKSIKAGPFRFNLSKSGIGISTGIKGLRVGTGPHGNYIHMGLGGFYYRKTLSNKASVSSGTALNTNNKQYHSQPIDDLGYGPFKEIDSGDIRDLTDSSSAELLEEFVKKQNKILLYPFGIVITILVLLLLPVGIEKWISGTILALGIISTYLIYSYDQIRKSIVLFYNIEGPYANAYQSLYDTFSAFRSVSKVWHVEAQADIYDRKRNAGASQVIKRDAIQLSIEDAPYIKTNIVVPSIKVGQQRLFFFPDRMLLFHKKKVGAVSYNDLNISVSYSQFVETGTIPKDAQVVGQTWKYVNKKGGPDKRFNDNREIPICLYEELHFTSATGLNEMIQFSKCGLGAGFKKSTELLALVLQSPELYSVEIKTWDAYGSSSYSPTQLVTQGRQTTVPYSPAISFSGTAQCLVTLRLVPLSPKL
jgi:hypothetical protein